MHTKDDRKPFDETVSSFQEFLLSRGMNTSLLWLNRKRITGYRCQFWIFRPEELSSADSSMEFFEKSRNGDWNLAIVAVTQFKDQTLAYVVRGQGESRMLNFSIHTPSEWNFRFVHSKVLWLLVCIYCRLRGLAPLLKYTDMTPGN